MLDCNHNSGPAVLRPHSNVVMQAKGGSVSSASLPCEDVAGRSALPFPPSWELLKCITETRIVIVVCVNVCVLGGLFTPGKHWLTTASSCTTSSTRCVDSGCILYYCWERAAAECTFHSDLSEKLTFLGVMNL